jgi:solute carrier family 35 (UDP-galactose transporter), member B1
MHMKFPLLHTIRFFSPREMDASTLRFGLLALGVWGAFLVFGFTQEHLTRHNYGEAGERFTHTQALVVAQSLGNVIVSGIAIYMQPSGRANKWTAGVPVKDWLIVAVSYFLAHSLGLASLKYIIFPLQVIIKSCKSVPVMLGEVVFACVKPTIAKTVGVLLLSAGVALFTFSSESGRKGHNTHDNTHLLYGVSLAGAALIFDAIYGPYQNKIVANWKPSSWSLMFNMNLYELIIAVGYDLMTSTELQETVSFWERYPVEFGYRVVLFCLSMSVGNVFIYKIQREFGALAVTKTTTVRKLVSLTISVVWFGHTLFVSHYAAMAMVFAAPLLEQRISKWESKPPGSKAKTSKKNK